ncbi:unnamed protein product [Medioppia subpectinata]|uniref:VWFC domain-containing protein n=1 Tax=Medioppia subpectinata TaxID=1979941 RepID=A0A7R9KN04_9ACAR|nr:unnamed protein product [Medioppia subpectinata]CAG2105395.1 unnamed protein product [Medioppia subpectinata]
MLSGSRIIFVSDLEICVNSVAEYFQLGRGYRCRTRAVSESAVTLAALWGQVMAEIDCGVGIECPEDRCCGRQVCSNTTQTQNQPKRDDKVCTYGGRQYRRGERIYPDEDNCKICHCDEHWDDSNPLNTLSCHQHQCKLQLNRDFAQGCLPIYHEGSCCPIEYKCPQTSETRGVLSIYSGQDLKECWFDGRNYTVGQQLVTGNPCVSCECKAPPDFTCVQKSCPTPKHNCYVGKWDNTLSVCIVGCNGNHARIQSYENITTAGCGVGRRGNLMDNTCFKYHPNSNTMFAGIQNGRVVQTGETPWTVFITCIEDGDMNLLDKLMVGSCC